MSFPIEAELIPLVEDTDGTVRVGQTRVTLDTVVSAFHEGATAQESGHQYSAFDLADVYRVIGYCLHRRTEVDAYLQGRKQRAESVRRENEDRFDPQGVRDRLLSRRIA